jgi:hypothetical protein
LCGQCELERHRHAQSQHLENYKKSKRWVWKISCTIHFKSQSYSRCSTCYFLKNTFQLVKDKGFNMYSSLISFPKYMCVCVCVCVCLNHYLFVVILWWWVVKS